MPTGKSTLTLEKRALASLTLENISASNMIAMGDGLLRAGDMQLARGLYATAERRATDAPTRHKARMRHGLVTADNGRAALSLDILTKLEASDLYRAFVGEGLATWLKTLPFDQDQRFHELVQRHAGLSPLANWHWNLTTVLWAVKACRDVPGDYVELGVFQGHTSLFCAEYVNFGGWPKRWWLYDTFDGIPDDQLDSNGWAAANERFYRGTFSVEEVTARFAHIANMKVIKGRVPEILTETSPDKIAFMHVDLNNAAAEIGALEHLFQRISPGGVVVFDDYCWASGAAQYELETLWFEMRGLHVLPLPTGQGVFVKK